MKIQKQEVISQYDLQFVITLMTENIIKSRYYCHMLVVLNAYRYFSEVMRGIQYSYLYNRMV